jgi:hypothetical protein
MTMTLFEIRQLSDRDLVMKYQTEDGSRANINRVIMERSVAIGVSNVFDFSVESARRGAVTSQPNNPIQPAQHDVVAPRGVLTIEGVIIPSSYPEPWQMAETMIATGYRGEQMRDPENVMMWLNVAITRHDCWSGIDMASAAKFWRAVWSAFHKWKAERRLTT